jgi:hypothetical protein
METGMDLASCNVLPSGTRYIFIKAATSCLHLGL